MASATTKEEQQQELEKWGQEASTIILDRAEKHLHEWTARVENEFASRSQSPDKARILQIFRETAKQMEGEIALFMERFASKDAFEEKLKGLQDVQARMCDLKKVLSLAYAGLQA